MDKRFIALLACLLFSLAAAEPLTLTDDLAGDECYPLGTTVDDAQFVYHYQYPQIAGDDEVSQLINNVYQAVRGEVVDFTAPILYEELTLPTASSVRIEYQVTCSNDEYFSVLFTAHNDLDGYRSTVYSAQVFSLTGGKAGRVTALPYLLGILKADETDSWLLDRQTAKADACIRRMLADQLELTGFPDGIDDEYLEYAFYPEEDFYMDETGALVFFLQPEADRAWLTFRFTLDEVLDEL